MGRRFDHRGHREHGGGMGKWRSHWTLSVLFVKVVIVDSFDFIGGYF
jgi:hypothetical protein